jgi:hypothetical protein
VNKQKPNQKQTFISSAIALFIVGGIGLFLSSKTMCLLGECIFITEGSSILDARGTRINSTTAGVIQAAPPYILGLGGVLLLAGLLKSDKEDTQV